MDYLFVRRGEAVGGERIGGVSVGGGDEEISEGLRRLTRVLGRGGVSLAGGLLGGEDGYGAEFENDVFMLHPFCWCEREECEWCVGCSCREEQWKHFDASGREIGLDSYYELSREERGVDTFVGERCAYCRGEFVGAPNFLHKRSGSRVKWYKYIGRDMEVDLKIAWNVVLQECLTSLGL